MGEIGPVYGMSGEIGLNVPAVSPNEAPAVAVVNLAVGGLVDSLDLLPDVITRVVEAISSVPGYRLATGIGRVVGPGLHGEIALVPSTPEAVARYAEAERIILAHARECEGG